MDLKQWRDLASDYIEGTLPADKMKQVQAFLATNAEARTDEALLRGITHHLSDLPEVDPPLFFADNVLSRIERERAEASQRGWRSWIPNMGRLAVGSLAAGGIMAALAWNFLFPKANNQNHAGVVGGLGTRVSTTTNAPVGPTPRLALSHIKRSEAAVTISVTLENAKSGMVLASVPGAPQQTGVSLSEKESLSRPLAVPIAPGMASCAFKLAWTAEGTQGEQWVITPLTPAQPTTTRLSFGMGELPLTPEALEELARRYGQGITVVDVPQATRRVQFDARNETLDELLTRHLGPLGMSISRSEDRVVITATR